MRALRTNITTLLAALGLLGLYAPPAQALPPALVTSGLVTLGWITALSASLLSLLLVYLAPRRRAFVAAGLALLVGASLVATNLPGPRESPAIDEKTLMLHAHTAKGWLNDPKNLWVDVRAHTAYQDGHLRGALNVPLLFHQVFDPALLNTLDETPALLAHLSHDPDDSPEAWGELDARFYTGEVAVVEALSRIEAMGQRGLRSGQIERVVLYCYSGRTSAALARVLRARELPVYVVDGGINALPMDALQASTTLERPRGESPFLLTTPSRRELAIWGRSAGPPEALKGISPERPIQMMHQDRLSARRATWTLALLSHWGYRGGADEPVTSPPVPPLHLATCALTLALLIFVTLWAAKTERRRLLSAEGPRSLLKAVLVIQAAGIWLLAYLSAPLWSDWGDAPLAELLPPIASESFRIVVALLALWLSLRPASHVLLDFIESARRGCGAPSLPPYPYPQLGARHLALIALSALLVTWVPAGSLALGLGLVVLSRLAVYGWGFELLWRVTRASSREIAAMRLLRAAGLKRSAEGTTHHILTRRAQEPGRFSRSLPSSGVEGVGLWSGGKDVNRAAQIAALLGQDISLGCVGREGAWASLSLLEHDAKSSKEATLHAQLLEGLWRAQRAGISVRGWRGRTLSSARYDEGAPQPSALTLSLLRRRGSPEGAAGSAARRLGLSPLRPVTMALGSHAYDLRPEEQSTPPFNVVSRLAVRAIVREALAPAPSELRGLWRGGLARQGEEASLAVMLARTEVERRAREAQVVALPLPKDDERATLAGPWLALKAPYELSAAELPYHAEELMELPSPDALAYGPGPDALRRWRGVLRSAEARRNAIRFRLACATRAIGSALRSAQGEAVFSASVADIVSGADVSTRGAETDSSREFYELPATLTLDHLERLGMTRDTQEASRVKGEPLGIQERTRGVVTHSHSPAPHEISVVARLDLTALTRCAPGALIIAERGSPLSHAAVIARERGVALILGAASARQIFKVGDTIDVSPKGSVTRVHRETPSP